MDMSNLLGRSKRHASRVVRQSLHDYRDQIEGLLAQRRARHEIDTARLKLGANGTSRLPDFIIIGAPKCATSWLAEALRRLPNIAVVQDEIEYFSTNLTRPLEWYFDHFRRLLSRIDETKQPRSGEKLIIGEKSASYCGLSPARIQLVHRLLPDARLILMIRDPVARHWSHAKRYFSKEKAQRRGYESLESRWQLRRFFRRTRHFSEFSKMIENWTNVYPVEQLLVVSQETAFADPGATIARAARHIGASDDLDAERMKQALRKDANQGPTVPMPPDVADYLEHMFAGERERLQGVLYARFSPEAVAQIGLPQLRM